MLHDFPGGCFRTNSPSCTGFALVRAAVAGHTPNMSRMAPYAAIPTPADAGIVMIHAQKILRATPQRTADNRRVAPTPMMAEAMTCVVLTGIPASALLASAMPPRSRRRSLARVVG